jgi:UDP-3-O-[3-hydroxymyristoyl] N-acetylglucosamine deacetylase
MTSCTATSSSQFPPHNRQTTLRRDILLAGRGAHGDQPARLRLSPAAADAGVVFLRADAEGAALIDAHWSRVACTILRTQIAGAGVSVSTVEHLLATLAALGVDNALIELDGPEIPAMDGSARAFVEAIDEAGLSTLEAPRRALRVMKPVRVSDGAGWAEIAPAEMGLSLDVEIAFASPIGRQRRTLSLTPESFRRELAGARSFGFLRDAERLWREGLALGASLDNSLVFDGERALNPQGQRFADECVRHKMLDAVGDLALAGAPLLGAFRSHRGGHALNFALVKALMTTPGAVEWTRPDGHATQDRRVVGQNLHI